MGHPTEHQLLRPYVGIKQSNNQTDLGSGHRKLHTRFFEGRVRISKGKIWLERAECFETLLCISDDGRQSIILLYPFGLSLYFISTWSSVPIALAEEVVS